MNIFSLYTDFSITVVLVFTKCYITIKKKSISRKKKTSQVTHDLVYHIRTDAEGMVEKNITWAPTCWG